MKTKILFALILSQPVPVWASSCPVNQQFSLIHTAHMYANSVIWLTQPDQALNFTAHSKSQMVAFKSLKINTDPPLLKYTPQQNYTPSQDYQIRFSEMKKMGLNPENYQFHVENTTPVADLNWVEKPTFLSYEISKGDLQFGASGQLSFSIQSNVKPEDYLVLVHIINISQFGDPKSLILQPIAVTQQNNPHLASINLGFSDCLHTFHFQENDDVWVKFDLISHDGKIAPWQGEALKFNIQKIAPSPPVESDVSSSFWTDVKQWFKQLFQRIFN